MPDAPYGSGRAALMYERALAAGYVLKTGRHTTVAASDTVDTGLSEVVEAWVELESDVSGAAAIVQAVIGDQAGSPAAGSILIKSWQIDPTAASIALGTVAATAFSKVVRWYAIGKP